jgi:N-acetylglucosamine kinase-like BadF-type ATPase
MAGVRQDGIKGEDMARLFLGVDGGQSSTTALIADETGRVLGAGRGGPCNHVRAEEGYRKFTGAIGGCLRMAAQNAGLDADSLHFEAACLGFSGGPADKQAILEEMIHTERLCVTNDALIALSGATAGGPGIIVIAGTGSISLGRNAAGRTMRVGGWGYVYGDEGGGFWMVGQALRASLRAVEHWGTPTRLHNLLLEATGAPDIHDLLHRFYEASFPRARIAALSVLVDRAAREGDAVAAQILTSAAEELAKIAAAARASLFSPDERVKVAYVGGVFRSEPVLRKFRALVERDGVTQVVPPAYGPAAGALLEAYRSANLSPSLSGVPESEKP